MTKLYCKFICLSLVAVVCLILIELPITASASAESIGVEAGLSEPIVVMTRNVYIGADIFRVVNETDFAAILAAIAAVYQTTQETDFPGRAEVLADEIEMFLPHVVGLQEVALVRRQSPGDSLSGSPTPATEVESDYLQILVDALANRGLNYVVAASVDNADIELPLIGATFDDIRLTDRDVILVRGDVPFGNSQTGNYADQVIIDLAGAGINFNRGYTQVDVFIDGNTYRVFNTHLDVGSQGAIQALQAAEMIALLDGTVPPLVLLGDFNSSPQSPVNEAYGMLIDNDFEDIWENRSIDDNDPGFTCCHSELLDNPLSQFTSRIDQVWARAGSSTILNPVEAVVTGNNPAMVTTGGLWPSDHGGVVASFSFVGNVFDTDSDNVNDSFDNCLVEFNPDQRDTDGDGYGNFCDADFNQDEVINFQDLGYFSSVFLTDDELADLDGNGEVNFLDFGLLTDRFFLGPGPAGLADFILGSTD